MVSFHTSDFYYSGRYGEFNHSYGLANLQDAMHRPSLQCTDGVDLMQVKFFFVAVCN